MSESLLQGVSAGVIVFWGGNWGEFWNDRAGSCGRGVTVAGKLYAHL
jgi:hypothetical protein